MLSIVNTLMHIVGNFLRGLGTLLSNCVEPGRKLSRNPPMPLISFCLFFQSCRIITQRMIFCPLTSFAASPLLFWQKIIFKQEVVRAFRNHPACRQIPHKGWTRYWTIIVYPIPRVFKHKIFLPSFIHSAITFLLFRTSSSCSANRS